MAIQLIRIKNVMAFGCLAIDPSEDSMAGAFELAFSNGINVILGENGTGKPAC